MKKGRGKKSPSKLPVPTWGRKGGSKRLIRGSVEQQPGSVDQRGTDHSPPISLPSLPQPSPQLTSPAVQSPQFGRLSTADFAQQASLNSLVSEGETERVPVIRENPWSIFSPRPQGFDKVQSAPSSPSRAAPAPLTRAGSAPSVSEFPAKSDSLIWDSSELYTTPPSISSPVSPERAVQKIPIISTASSSLTPTPAFLQQSEEDIFVFPPPIISFLSPRRTVDESQLEESEDERDKMAEQKAQEMKEANTQLKYLETLILRDIADLTVEELDERGSEGVKEELDDIKVNQNKFQWQVAQYALKFEGVPIGAVPTIRDTLVPQDIPFWENKLETTNKSVKVHRRNILKKLKEMEDGEKAKSEAADLKEKKLKQSKDAQHAKMKALEADQIYSRIQNLFPVVTDWAKASRQQVLEGYKIIPKINAEYDKMLAAYQTAENVGYNLTIPGVHMDILRDHVNNLRIKLKDFTTQVTAENDRRELRAGTDGYKNNVPLPRFRGSQGEDWFTFESDLKDAMERNNVAGPDKFDQLRACLGGEAARYVPVSVEKDFKAAMETLKGIYGKTVTVMKARLEEIKKLGVCPDEFSFSGKNNFQAVVTFCLKMENLLKTIIKLAKDHPELAGDIHSKLLQESIINQLQSEQAKKIKKTIKNLDGEAALMRIQNFIQEYREESQEMTEHPSPKTRVRSPPRSPKQTSNLSQRFKRNHSSREFHGNCKICLKLEKRRDFEGLFIDHSSAHPTGCPRFQRMTFKERAEICSAAGLCWFCLNFRDMNHECRKENPWTQCKTCKKHVWICQEHYQANIPLIKNFVDKFGIEVEMKATVVAAQSSSYLVGENLTQNEIINNMKNDLSKENKTLVDIPAGNSLFLLPGEDERTPHILGLRSHRLSR